MRQVRESALVVEAWTTIAERKKGRHRMPHRRLGVDLATVLDRLPSVRFVLRRAEHERVDDDPHRIPRDETPLSLFAFAVEIARAEALNGRRTIAIHAA